MRFYPMRGTVLNYNFFVLCSVGIGAFFLTDLVCSILIPGNHEDLNRPWRVWSGDPCQPCDIGSLIGNTFVRIGACRTPCFRNGTKACVPVGEYEFRCDCTDDYDGQFCEKPLWKERDVMLPLISSQNGNNITTGVIPIGNDSDYLFQCNYPNGTNVQYELTYIQDYFRRRIRRGQLRCRNERFDNNFNDRCRDHHSDNSCQFCRSATNSSQSNHFDQYAFGNFVWDIYDGRECENVVEIYIIYRNSLSSRIDQTIRDNVNCDERRVDEETYRGGCRLSTTSSSSKSSCIANLHMGHRCATCDRGLWGNKCQFAVEGKDGWNGCPDARYKKDGPCGIAGTLVQRPNGKFCVCPPGKVDGFVNVFEDRVKDGDCSPAGNETAGENDLVHFADKNSKYYKFFVGMSQFHTYYGCQIDDPCQTFECKNNGTKEILDLIDEDSYGFKIVNFTRSRISALEINAKKFKCGCNCAPGYEGEHCEHRNPCFFDKHYCQNLGICQRVDDMEKRCECVQPFGGSRCELVNPCQIQEVCDGPIRKCFPCKHGGNCNTKSVISPFSLSYEFSCDCTSISYVGERCEFAEGEIELRILSVDPMSVVVGSEEIYEILVRRKGDVPHIIVDVGDGFHFSVTENSLASTLGQADTTQDSPQTFFYKFTHTFTKKGQYLMRTFTLNGDPNPNETPKDIDVIYLAGQSFKNVTASLPIEFKCLPGARLINVASTVDESTQYTRKDAFTVEALLEPKCDQPFKFNYTWNLHKLDFLFPTPSADNNWHVNKVVTDVSQKYVNFKPRSLLNGRYVIVYVVNVQVNGLVRSNSAKGFFDIELNPPKIIVQGGLDRSVNVFQETILDASDSIDESFPELSQQLSFVWHCDSPCKLQGPSGPWEGPVLTIAAKSLIVGREYKFHLDVSTKNEDKKRSVMETIRLIGSTGSLQVQCIENCERLNPGAEILVHCTCISCPSPPVVQFVWEPFSDEVVPISKQNQSLAGIVLPNVVLGDQVSRAVVCKEVATNLIAKLKVEINSPPSGGICTIEPMHGVYLETPFNLNCQGFLDEDVPLQYSFYVTTDDRPGKDVENLLLLAHDTNPRAANVYLPYKPNGGDVVLVIRVTDNKELSTIRKLKVSVALPHAAEYPQLLRNLISGDESLMKRRKMFGDDQGAMQLQLVVLFGFLDNQFSELQPGEINELRMAISNVLAEVPLHSFKAVEQALESLFLLKQIDEDESLESLKENSIIFFNGASLLAEYVLSDNQIIPTQSVMTLTRAATDIARRILKTSKDKGIEEIQNQPQRPGHERTITDFDSRDDVGRDYFFEVQELLDTYEMEGDQEVAEGLNVVIQEYAKISHHAFTGLEHLLDAVGERLEDGRKYIVETEDLTLFVESERETSPKGFSLELKTNLGKIIKLRLSGVFQNVLISQGISHIMFQVAEVLPNPFFDDLSAIPLTPILSVLVKDRTPGGGRLPIPLERLEEPFEFYLPFTPADKSLLVFSKSTRTVMLKPLTEMSKSDLQPFHLILPYNTQVEIVIEDFTMDTEFIVVVLKDVWPTTEDFCESDQRKLLNNATGYALTFYTETLRINQSEPEEAFLEYYVGIFPFQQATVLYKQEHYSVYFTRRSCLFRDDNRKTWSEEGCTVANDSNSTYLHCLCNHASIFAGTQFALPHGIPTINVFDFDPEKFPRNETVFSTICIVCCGYVIGIIICYVLDRRQKNNHVGITIISDLEDHKNYYLVTVWTGNLFQSGTTANVSLQIYGSNGRSRVYVLKEKASPVFKRGGTDSFLVSSSRDLGELEKIRVWHDNLGSSPNWFCRKIIIREVKSEKESYFFIDHWLQVSGAESTIIFEKNAATDNEFKKFRRNFHENLSDLIDNSMWISLFWYRAASTFTRCQRLSRVFAVCSFYMLLNMLIWFDEEQADDEACDLYVFAYALAISILTLPVGLILLLMFRCINRRFIPTLIVLDSTAKQLQAETISTIPTPSNTIIIQNDTKSEIENDLSIDISGAGDSVNLENVSEVSSNFSIPSTNIEDLEFWLDQSETPESMMEEAYPARLTEETGITTYEQIALGRTGFIHAIKAVDADSFVFPGDHCIAEIENLIDEEILLHLKQLEIKTTWDEVKVKQLSDLETNLIDDKIHLEMPDMNAIQEVEKDESEIDTTSVVKIETEKTQGLNFETCEMSPVTTHGFYFPWWFIFIAWFFCIGTALTCLYFTLDYGLEISDAKSLNWLIGFASSVFFSLVFSQPLSCIIATFVIVVFRASSAKNYENRFQILLKEEVEIEKAERKSIKCNVFHSSGVHFPLSGNEIFRLRLQGRRRDKIKRVLLKTLFYGFILVPMIIIAYTGHSSDMFKAVNNMRRLLKLNADQILIGKLRSFDAVNNEGKLFEYLENILVPNLYPEVLYNGVRVRPRRFEPSYMTDGQSLLVGVPRIRQVRVRPEVCNVPSSIENTIGKCFKPYHWSTRDTETYNPLWRPVVNGMRITPSLTNDIWKFHEFDPGFTPSLQLRGDMGNYDGGGYIVELGRRKRETESVLRYLDRSRWIDHQTRAVFIEFTVWNPNVDIYLDVTLLYERGAAELAHATFHITPLFLSATNCFQTSPWLSISYAIIVLSFFVLLIIFFWNIFSSSQLRVYRNLWFWMDFIVICSILISMSIAFKTRYVVIETLDKVQQMKINEFSSLQNVAYWNELQGSAFSITQSICFMKIWRVFTFMEKRFYIIFLTVKLAADTIRAYVLVTIILVVAFACAGHFIFGNDMLEFDSLRDSLVSLGDQVLSVDFFMELQSSHRILGPIYSCIFGFIVTCVSLNLLLYIMNQSLHSAKRLCVEKTLQGNLYTALRHSFSRCRKDSISNVPSDSILLAPDVLKDMKIATAAYFRKCMTSNEAVTLKIVKKYANLLINGTGYHVSSRKSRKYVEQIMKEAQMIEMRSATAEFLMSRIGTEMSGEEFDNYAFVNREVISLRVQRLDSKLQEITEKLRKFRLG